MRCHKTLATASTQFSVSLAVKSQSQPEHTVKAVYKSIITRTLKNILLFTFNKYFLFLARSKWQWITGHNGHLNQTPVHLGDPCIHTYTHSLQHFNIVSPHACFREMEKTREMWRKPWQTWGAHVNIQMMITFSHLVMRMQAVYHWYTWVHWFSPLRALGLCYPDYKVVLLRLCAGLPALLISLY